MDFADSPEHAAFRREFRDWLEANLPEELKVEDAQDQRVSPDREILDLQPTWQPMTHVDERHTIQHDKHQQGRKRRRHRERENRKRGDGHSGGRVRDEYGE